MLRLVIFATLISMSLAKAGGYHHQRYRRNEGNENSVKYHRPKYVYKFHGDDSDEESIPAHVEYKTDYKYQLTEDKDDDMVSHKHHVKHEEEAPEKVTHYGYQHSSFEDDNSGGAQKDTEHHVEIQHEHGTSHQSFTMHHFHPAKLFIKKQDLHYLKKPIETGVTKHSFKVMQRRSMMILLIE